MVFILKSYGRYFIRCHHVVSAQKVKSTAGALDYVVIITAVSLKSWGTVGERSSSCKPGHTPGDFSAADGVC